MCGPMLPAPVPHPQAPTANRLAAEAFAALQPRILAELEGATAREISWFVSSLGHLRDIFVQGSIFGNGRGRHSPTYVLKAIEVPRLRHHWTHISSYFFARVQCR